LGSSLHQARFAHFIFHTTACFSRFNRRYSIHNNQLTYLLHWTYLFLFKLGAATATSSQLLYSAFFIGLFQRQTLDAKTFIIYIKTFIEKLSLFCRHSANLFLYSTPFN
jgi:hypothetical protein